MMQSRKRSRIASLLFYPLALILVLLAPVMGLMAATVPAWHSLLAGSIWYMPLGLVLVLVTIAIVQNHRLFDLALLGLLALGVIAWFRTDPLQQGRLLDAVQALATQTHLMVGVLLAMILALFLVHATHRFGRSDSTPPDTTTVTP